MKEIWKDIPSYEWLYQASNLWGIKSLSRKYSVSENVLKPLTQSQWYILATLRKNKIWKSYRVHRLIMLTFNWSSKLQVNHKNWIKADNRLENLEYCTSSENIRHAYDVLWHKWIFQTNHPKYTKWKFGKDNKKSVQIIQRNMGGLYIKRWDGISYAARELWLSQWNISMCLTWKSNHCWWYKWEYF